MDAGRPITLITGASAGIGEALAKVFAAHGHELVLVARREQALDRIADGIAATGKPRPMVLALDIALSGTAERIKTELAGRGLAAISWIDIERSTSRSAQPSCLMARGNLSPTWIRLTAVLHTSPSTQA